MLWDIQTHNAKCKRASPLHTKGLCEVMPSCKYTLTGKAKINVLPYLLGQAGFCAPTLFSKSHVAANAEWLMMLAQVFGNGFINAEG